MNAMTLAFASVMGYNESIEQVVQKNFKAALKKNVSGWSFTGSYKTYQSLKAQGKIN